MRYFKCSYCDCRCKAKDNQAIWIDKGLMDCPNKHVPGHKSSYWIECLDDKMAPGGIFFEEKESG